MSGAEGNSQTVTDTRYFLTKSKLSIRSERQGWLVMVRARSTLVRLGGTSKEVLDCIPNQRSEAAPLLKTICRRLNIAPARAMDVIERFIETGILSLETIHDNNGRTASLSKD